MAEHAKSINGDMRKRVVVDTQAMDWQASPNATVWRKRLHLVGPEEAGQVTSVVRFEPGASFAAHGHPDGEEYFVLDGVFSDQTGDWRAGSYLLNPEGYAHAPHSEEGCTIFVKLRQYPGMNRSHIALDTNELNWRATGRLGVIEKVLYAEEGYPETVCLEKWMPGAEAVQDYKGGAEIFVISGSCEDEKGVYATGAWARFPQGFRHKFSSAAGATLWVKRGSVAQLKGE